ncbi:nitrogen regulatory protein P-II 1 [Marchantia polymorpha subsp. ruderalis]|uniref:PII protein n=2 Tax=Marchantia polymorpha TaxID=3197 RepID=A0AAF6ATN2_MARPO|nr:hypothetical protein MARPO_0061s0127 [Marchantia polymorpha]BBM99802.1 hypothetical protein Mp_1g23930 [Marchantia polymorpha subsp. ruderalis]|eukprot:PTQ36882.1 hypothetical protein MARPO_0061s0127 [Marchantia polymorpha]
MASAAAFMSVKPCTPDMCLSGSLSSLAAPSSRVVSFASRRDLILRAWPRGPRSNGRESGNFFVFSARASGSNGSNGRDDRDSHAPGAGYVPQSDFYKIEAIVRPWRLQHVASALIKMGIRGVTVYDVRGFGAQGGARERYAGSEFTEDSFVQKVKLEIVVSQDQVEAVLATVIENARTGEIGDGKVFISPVSDVVRVRTGERGLKAERMAGGRAEILGVVEK